MVRGEGEILPARSQPRLSGPPVDGGDDLYRLRVGDYRVIYQIADAALLVLVVKIGHRREVYRG